MSKPFTPDDLTEKFKQDIPVFVIDAVNELLLENYTPSCSIRVLVSDVVTRIAQKSDLEREDIYGGPYLYFAPVFEDAGWKVEKYTPVYTETTPSYYTFTRKK